MAHGHAALPRDRGDDDAKRVAPSDLIKEATNADADARCRRIRPDQEDRR